MNASDTTKHDAGDEISLRDLYLILKRNVWWVAGAALLVGVITFVILGLQPPRFQAEGTTIITPAQLNLQGRQGLTFNPTPIVSFETYSTLARSRPVLETVLNKLPEPLTIAELERIGNLRRLLAPGGGQAAQAAPLVVIHQVTHEDPELAARVANTWAEVSLETIRNSVLGTLEPVREITQRELSRLSTALEEAEAALSAFEQETNVALLRERFERHNVRLANLELQTRDLERALAVTRARLEAQQAQLASELANPIKTDPTSSGVIAEFSLTEAVAVVTEQVVFLQRASAQTHAVFELHRLLREQEVILAAQQRELAELTRTLERDHEALSVLQQELASSEVRLEQLTRARDEALEAYQEVVRIDPTISYFTALSPVSARVLSEATVPVEPVGRGRLLATVLAVLVTGAVLLVFVFLREAITDPAVADSKWRKARSSLT